MNSFYIDMMLGSCIILSFIAGLYALVILCEMMNSNDDEFQERIKIFEQFEREDEIRILLGMTPEQFWGMTREQYGRIKS